MKLSENQLFDYKTLFLIREEIIEKHFPKESKKDKLNTAMIKALNKKLEYFIKQTSPGRVGDRMLKTYLMEDIDDETKIGMTTTGNSVIDTLCKFLGYKDGLFEFQQKRKDDIDRIVLRVKKSYHFSHKEDFSKKKSDNQYFLIDYYSSNNQFSRGIVTLKYKSNRATLILPHPNLGDPSKTLNFEGTMILDVSGFLNVYLNVTHNDRTIRMVIKVFLDHPTKTDLNYFIGMFVTTAAYAGINAGGLFLGTRYLDYDKCFQDYQLPLSDERVKELLKFNQLKTPVRAFQDLDTLIKATELENGIP